MEKALNDDIFKTVLWIAKTACKLCYDYTEAARKIIIIKYLNLEQNCIQRLDIRIFQRIIAVTFTDSGRIFQDNLSYLYGLRKLLVHHKLQALTKKMYEILSKILRIFHNIAKQD